MENTLTLPQTILLQKRQVLASYGGTLVLILNGISMLITGQNNHWGLIISSTLIVLGTGLLIFIFLESSKKSKYATKFQVSESSVLFKTDFWKPAVIIPWADIRQIHFSPYQIDFTRTSQTQSVPYATDAAKSLEIKQLIRNRAEQLHIAITGG